MVNLSLAEKIKKSDNPEFIRLHARELMQEYSTMTHIYTDGSKTTDEKVGSAFCVPSLGVEQAIRISDDSDCIHCRINCNQTCFNVDKKCSSKQICYIQ